MLVSLVPSQLASGTVGPTKTLLKAVPGIVAGVATSPEVSVYVVLLLLGSI
jgi:hypothetical protein